MLLLVEAAWVCGTSVDFPLLRVINGPIFVVYETHLESVGIVLSCYDIIATEDQIDEIFQLLKHFK